MRLRRVPAETTAPSIDRLLTSAAKAFGERAIAVILTGTGADGSAGAWEVKRAGGAVVVENPETAAFPSMPAAVSPSIVDARVDLGAIAGVLVGLIEATDGRAGATAASRRTRATPTPTPPSSSGSGAAAGSTTRPTSRPRSSVACAAG